MDQDKINYLEFPARDMAATKKFFSEVFSWSFEDYGPEYMAFSNAGIDGGLYLSDLSSKTATVAALVGFYSRDL